MTSTAPRAADAPTAGSRGAPARLRAATPGARPRRSADCRRDASAASTLHWCRCRFRTPCPRCWRSCARAPSRFAAIIDRGSFASIYVPAFQAKDLALALDAHKDELPADRRKVAEPAIAKLVRSAYLLDAFGDIGNKQQIVERMRCSSTPRRTSSRRFLHNHERTRHVHRLGLAAALVAGALASRRSAGSAQSDHVEVHLQRRRVSDSARAVHAVPRRGRGRADVADDLRGGVPLGRIDPRRARRGAHAAVERRRRVR